MSLLQEVSVISTNWKQIIEKYPFWDTLNKEYEKELLYCYEYIELYPPLNTIFRCFTYFNIEDTNKYHAALAIVANAIMNLDEFLTHA